jgi:glutathione synthase/RimK-type ligase-like ATP-grasp enzyme
MNILLCWERYEENSWTPVLAEAFRAQGDVVTEVHDLDGLRELDLGAFDICLPRFRVGAANMSSLDEALVRAGVPMLNSRETRMACENKGVAHLDFDVANIPQPRSFVVSREGEVDRRLAWAGEALVKPLYGCRGAGIEVLTSLDDALERALARREDTLVQEMIWPARSWRIIVGRVSGITDPYFRRPPESHNRILSISTGSEIARESPPVDVERVAREMLTAVNGDLLAVDVLEQNGVAFALEINHNFDAHGGTEPALDAFRREMDFKIASKPVNAPTA